MREPRRDQPTERFGSYALYECLGRGGMATVHRAQLTGEGGFARPVALKRMLPWLTQDAEYVKQFVREARLASQLRHVNIVQTYDLGRIDDTYYIAMELVPGRDLRELLRHCHQVTGPMPVPAAINILFQLCDALDYAHTFRDEQGRPLGLVHRDISPANVILAEDGVAKLVDFGVAKGSTQTLATASGLLKGKFAYMAPEMLQGQVDARADLFAVGVCAWEILTAQPLFAGGDDMEILQRVTSWDPPPPSTYNPAVPRALDAWVAMALTKQPQRRFQSAAQMRAGLELVARTPAMRATTTDVAAWVAWAFAQQQPVAPAPVPVMPAGTPAGIAAMPGTIVIEDAAIEAELPRRVTAVGAPAAPARARPASSAPPPVAPPGSLGSGPIATPAARTLMVDDAAVVASHELPGAPRHATLGGATPRPIPAPTPAHGYGPAAQGAAAAARTVLVEHGSEPVPVPMPPAASEAYAWPGPGAHALPTHAPPVYPPAALPQPAQVPPGWHVPAPPVPAPAPAPIPDPTTVSTARGSSLGLVIVLVLCAAAAVGGFFLVQQLL